MTFQNAALNFMVEKAGKLVPRLICQKPQQVIKNPIGLRLETHSYPLTCFTGIAKSRAKNTLDINSKTAKFFGVNEPIVDEHIIMNHLELVKKKCDQCGILDSFPRNASLNLDNKWTFDNVWNRIWSGYHGKQFESLYEHPARMTFYGKIFGKNGETGAHTIGILYHPKSKTLYVLDSLPNSEKEVQEYQDLLRNTIFDCPYGNIKNIIFSNKPQQNMNEYTCNNWTLANIETLQKALNEGKTIDTVERLNEVLPDDINKILKEQYELIRPPRFYGGEPHPSMPFWF